MTPPPDWRTWIVGIVGAAIVAAGAGLMTATFALQRQVADASSDTRALRETVDIRLKQLSEDMQEFVRIESRLSSLERHATIIGEAYADYVPWKKEVERRLVALEKLQ